MSRDGRAISDTASGSMPGDSDLEAGLQQSSAHVGRAAAVVHSDTASGSGQPQQPEIQMVSTSSRPEGAQTESNLPPAPVELVPIPRVRAIVRRVASHHFTPQIVQIGPYNVDQVGSYLLQSTAVKEKAVQHIIEKGSVTRDDLKAVLSNLVNEVRPCYTHLHEDSMNAEAFNSMLLLDGCYLICCFMVFQGPTEISDGSSGSRSGVGSSGGGGGGVSGSNGGGGSGGNSSNGGGGSGGSGGSSGSGSGSDSGSGEIAAKPMTLYNYKDNTLLLRDILYLLENQIPLCVMETIINYINGTENIPYAPDYIYEGVQKWLHKQHYISKERQPVQSESRSPPSDLLHLVYSYFRRRPDYQPPGFWWAQQARDHTVTGRWRRATEYHKYADLKFKCREQFEDEQQWTILDLHIEGDKLYIPFLEVTTDTCTMLRNLIALEEQEAKRPVTAYCLFMSQVACTEEDVQLLQRAKVLQHFMPNDKEAAEALAYLCDGVAMEIDSLERNYLKPLWHNLHNRCSVGIYNFKGFFRDKYCSTVFYQLVFCVVTLLFVSEVTQAICSVIATSKG